jgi:hypothetical protein
MHLALAVSLQADTFGAIEVGCYSHSTNIMKRFTVFCKSYVSLSIKKLLLEKLRKFLIV